MSGVVAWHRSKLEMDLQVIAILQNPTIVTRLIYGTSLIQVSTVSWWHGCYRDMFIVSNSSVGPLFDHAANGDALLVGRSVFTGPNGDQINQGHQVI